MPSAPSILIHADVGRTLGYGHGVRSAAVAGALRDRGADVAFVTAGGSDSQAFFEDRGFRAFPLAGDEAASLEVLCGERRPAAVVFDIRSDLPVDVLASLRMNGTVTAVIDDPSPRRLAADLAFYPPVPQVDALDWSGFTGTLYTGWDWVVLRPDIAAWRAVHTNEGEGSGILVAMGGSDPHKLTLRVLAALELCGLSDPVTVLIGPGFHDRERLGAWSAATTMPHRLVSDPPEVPALMGGARLAVQAFGVSAYELAVLGVPAVYVAFDADGALSAGALVDAGFGTAVPADAIDTTLGPAVSALASSAETRRAMRDAGRKAMDGLGAARVASVIWEASTR